MERVGKQQREVRECDRVGDRLIELWPSSLRSLSIFVLSLASSSRPPSRVHCLTKFAGRPLKFSSLYHQNSTRTGVCARLQFITHTTFRSNQPAGELDDEPQNVRCSSQDKAALYSGRMWALHLLALVPENLPAKAFEDWHLKGWRFTRHNVGRLKEQC